uniref:DUF7798 domain-containing protein n=1 Tax=Manihot esculenta TaxID=3983 RepID=A0A2C9UFV4_MANES
MEEDKSSPPEEDIRPQEQQTEQKQEPIAEGSPSPPPPEPKTSRGGWGGWGFSPGFSPFSVLSELQKAAEEISRNAAVVAEKAAKSIADIQNVAEDSESSKGEEEQEESDSDKETEAEDENDKLRKSALDKLEKASKDSFLGQGLKVLDHSVDNFASGAWQALGNAWKGSSNLVQKLENSAVNLAESIQHGGIPGGAGSVAPSLLETGKSFTAKGMQVLEYVGKETMDLLITETEADEDRLLEEVTFDRCFYIYGGPEQLEELEALSSHYALLFNRRKAKLPLEQKSVYDGKLKLVQQMFSLSIEMDKNDADFNKGRKIENGTEGSSDEMKILHDSSIKKAADMAAGFTGALAGLTANDIFQKTAGRLETLHSEGVHRLSEMSSLAVSQLLMYGKSIISNANKVQEEGVDKDIMKIDWPEDSVEKAKIIRREAQSMAGYVEGVCNSFITGISGVAEAYVAAVDSHDNLLKTSTQEKANTFSELIRADWTAAVSKILDGLQYLSYVVISTSMLSA